MNRKPRRIVRILLSCVPLAAVGCDREVIGEVASLSGAYLGDVVTVVATGYLMDAVGIENLGDALEHDEEHSHNTETLHNHEH